MNHVRFFARLALGASWIALAGAVAAGWLLRYSDLGAVGAAGLFGLLFAAPYSVAQLVAMNADGRLDHVRLTGLSGLRMLAAIAAGTAGPWLILSLVAFTLTLRTAGELHPRAVVVALLLVGASVVWPLAASCAKGAGAADPRLMMAAASIGGAGLAIAGTSLLTDDLRVQPWFVRALGARAGLVLPIAAVVEVAAIAVWVRIVSRRFERGGIVGVAGVHPPDAIRRALPDWPILRPGLLNGAVPATYVGAIGISAILLLSVLPLEGAFGVSSALAYGPLAAGVFVISSTTRRDSEDGRHDLIRVAPIDRLYAALGSIAGAWLPFIVASACCVLIAAALWRRLPAFLGPVLITLAAVAPTALVEGWRQRWPLVYTAPVAATFLVLAGGFDIRVVWDTVRFGSLQPVYFSYWPISCVLSIWIPWVAAVRTFERPLRPPLTGWPGVAAVTALSVSPAIFLAPFLNRLDWFPMVAIAAGCLIVTADFTVDPDSNRAVDRWGPPLAAFVVTSVLLGLGPIERSEAVLMGLVPAAGWWAARRVQQVAGVPVVSTAARLVLIALLAWFAFEFTARNLFVGNPWLGLQQRYVISGFIGMGAGYYPVWYAMFNARVAAVVLSVALAIEIAYHLSRWFSRRVITSRSTRATHDDLAE